MPYAPVSLIYNPAVRALCRKPYPGHPKGCPNFGVAPRCPGKVPLLYDLYRVGGPFYFVWTTFDMAAHVQHMRLRHPTWTDRQLRCVLYWQNKARKRLRNEIVWVRMVREDLDDSFLLNETPEALGVDVTATMKSINVILEWPPEHLTYQIALLGMKK